MSLSLWECFGEAGRHMVVVPGRAIALLALLEKGLAPSRQGTFTLGARLFTNSS